MLVRDVFKSTRGRALNLLLAAIVLTLGLWFAVLPVQPWRQVSEPWKIFGPFRGEQETHRKWRGLVNVARTLRKHHAEDYQIDVRSSRFFVMAWPLQMKEHSPYRVYGSRPIPTQPPPGCQKLYRSWNGGLFFCEDQAELR